MLLASALAPQGKSDCEWAGTRPESRHSPATASPCWPRAGQKQLRRVCTVILLWGKNRKGRGVLQWKFLYNDQNRKKIEEFSFSSGNIKTDSYYPKLLTYFFLNRNITLTCPHSVMKSLFIFFFLSDLGFQTKVTKWQCLSRRPPYLENSLRWKEKPLPPHHTSRDQIQRLWNRRIFPAFPGAEMGS